MATIRRTCKLDPPFINPMKFPAIFISLLACAALTTGCGPAPTVPNGSRGFFRAPLFDHPIFTPPTDLPELTDYSD